MVEIGRSNKLSYFDNWKQGIFVDQINQLIYKSQRIQIVSGYVTENGIDLLKESLLSFIERQGELRIVVGMPSISGISKSDINALLELDSQSGYLQYDRIRVAVVPNHGKVYRFTTEDETVAFTGSSNLTESGLRKNIEFNIRMNEEGTVHSENFFASVWNEAKPIKVAERFIINRIDRLLLKRPLITDALPDNVSLIPELKAPLGEHDHIDIVIKDSNLNWGTANGRRRSKNEAILYFLSATNRHALRRNFFPNRDLPFNVTTDDNEQFQMKISGGKNAGDPVGKNLLSYPRNTILGIWFDKRGVKTNDILRIWRITPDREYYFEVLKPLLRTN